MKQRALTTAYIATVAWMYYTQNMQVFYTLIISYLIYVLNPKILQDKKGCVEVLLTHLVIAWGVYLLYPEGESFLSRL